MDDMLTSVDREVLVAILIGGGNTPSNIAEMIDRHPNSIGDSMDRLEEEGLVLPKGSGVYALTYSGVTTARSVNREFEIEISIPWEADASETSNGDNS